MAIELPSYLRHAFILLKGSAGARLISLAGAPVLTRIYDPENFAILALYTSILMMVQPVASLRYEMAIVIAKSDLQAKRIMSISILLSMLAMLFLLVIAIWKSNWIAAKMGNADLAPWLYLLGLNVFIAVYNNALAQWCTRKGYFRLIAASGFLTALATLLFSILFGLLTQTNGLLVGLIGGSASALLYMMITLPGQEWKGSSKLHPGLLFRDFRRYSKFPRYNLPNAVVDGMRQSSINAMIGKYYGSANLGYFSYAWRMVWIPLSFVGSAISQVFFSRMAARTKAGQPVMGVVWSMTWKMAVISAPFYMVIYFYAPVLFRIIFGDRWEVAGEIARHLVPWLYMNFLTSPLSVLFLVWEKQEYLLILALTYFGVAVSVLYYTRDWDDYFQVIDLLSYSMAAVLSAMMVAIFFLGTLKDIHVKGKHA